MKLYIVSLRNIGIVSGVILFFMVIFGGTVSALSSGQLEILTNAERQKGGLSSLTHSEVLKKSAEQKAAHMFQEQYWAHSSPAGIEPWKFMTDSGYEYLHAGENLARDFNTDEGLMRAWIASETHRGNILNTEYTEIGIASVSGVFEGEQTTFVVAHYGVPQPLSYREPTGVSTDNGQLSPPPPNWADESARYQSFSRFWQDISKLTGSIMKLSVF